MISSTLGKGRSLIYRNFLQRFLLVKHSNINKCFDFDQPGTWDWARACPLLQIDVTTCVEIQLH
jgi:hypothetical protein